MNQAPYYDAELLSKLHKRYFVQLGMKRNEKRVSYFSYEEQVKFLRQYEESNRRVAKEFLGREDGVLFTEPIEELPKWEVNMDTMYKDIILLFAEIVADQQRQLNDLSWELHNPVVHFKKMGKKMQYKIKERFR